MFYSIYKALFLGPKGQTLQPLQKDRSTGPENRSFSATVPNHRGLSRAWDGLLGLLGRSSSALQRFMLRASGRSERQGERVRGGG